MKLKEGFLLREVAGQNVVLPTGAALDLNAMITLNDTGCTLWKRLERGAERDELVAALLDEYEVDAPTAENAVDGFVARLKELDLLAGT